MANPQKENGHTSLANELIEHLARHRFSGQEYQILWVVWRKTWGWQKKEDAIPLSQFSKLCNMGRNQVVRSIKLLVSKRVLTSTKSETGYITKYRFNKDYETWSPSHKKETSSLKTETTPVSKMGTKLVSKKRHSKEKKETNTKEIAATSAAVSPKIKYNPLGAEIIKYLEEVDPKNKTYYNNTTQRKSCDYLLEEYGLEEVLKRISVLSKTNRMQFFPKINSPYDLKEKWVKLNDQVEVYKQEKKKITKSTPNFIL